MLDPNYYLSIMSNFLYGLQKNPTKKMKMTLINGKNQETVVGQ